MDMLHTLTATVAQRLVVAALEVFTVVTAVFVLTHMIGNPTVLIAGDIHTKRSLLAIARANGLNEPIWRQYVSYLAGLVRGNLGYSLFNHEPVTSALAYYFPSTAELVCCAGLLAIVIAVPLAFVAARRPKGVIAKIGHALVVLGLSVPNFWLALLFIFLFYYKLGIAPPPVGELSPLISPPPSHTGMLLVDAVISGDWAALRSGLGYVALPATCLAVTAIPALFQVSHAVFQRVLNSEGVAYRRFSGVPRGHRTLWEVREASPPIVTMIAMTLGYMIGNTAIIESIFSWPGIGLFALNSMENFDYEPIAGLVIVVASVYVALYLIADLVNMLLDARIR